VAIHLNQRKDAFTKSTFAERVVALNAFVLDLLLLYNPDAAALTYDLHEAAII
jgi:hypothetical protein